MIDCSPEMFLPNDQLKYLVDSNDEIPKDEISSSFSSSSLSAFQAAMKCISSTMKNKIISNETDKIGVICYGTGKSKNPAGFPQIYLLQDLNVPDAPSILEIEKYFCRPESFSENIGSVSTTEAPFGNVFWTAANTFSDKKLASFTKRIFLFTCEDNPNGRSEGMQRAAKTRGKDLTELGINLELFALPRSNNFQSFNFKLFYNFIIPDLMEIQSSNDQLSKFEELLSRVRRRETRKRALAQTQLTFGPSMSLSVKMFSLYMETKKGQYVWMNERTGQVMTPKTEWSCKESGKIVQSSEFKFSFDYGGETVKFRKRKLN